MSPEKPLIYLILGATGSGRREVVANLIAGGLDEGDRASFALRDGTGRRDRRPARPGATMAVGGRPHRGARVRRSHARVLGRRRPAQSRRQIEACLAWVPASGGVLARIVCVIHCGLVARHHEVITWHDACVHFSDVVLLNHREGVDNKWMSDFQVRYTSKFLPCIFEFVKHGRVKNPAIVLDPLTRRMSHVFDEELNWEVSGTPEDEAEGDEEVEAHPEVDPYLERLESGRRVKEIPDVAKYLA